MIAADIFLPCCISSLASQSPKDGLFIGDCCSTRQCLTALETAMLTLQDEEVLNVLGETFFGETQGVHYSNWILRRLPYKKTTVIRFQKVLQVLGKRHIQTCLLKIGHGINWLINGSSMGMVRGLSSFAHLAYPLKQPVTSPKSDDHVETWYLMSPQTSNFQRISSFHPQQPSNSF